MLVSFSTVCLLTYIGLTTNYLGGEEHLMKSELREGTTQIKQHVEELLNQESYRRVDEEVSDWNTNDIARLAEESTYELASEPNSNPVLSPSAVEQAQPQERVVSDTSSETNEDDPFLDQSDDDEGDEDNNNDEEEEEGGGTGQITEIVLRKEDAFEVRSNGYVELIEALDEANKNSGIRKSVILKEKPKASEKIKDGKIQVKLDLFKFIKK